MANLDDKAFRDVFHRCNSALEDIRWQNNAAPSSDLTFAQALEAAKEGKDMGLSFTKSLQPQSRNHNEWMDYSLLLTMLFNRNRPFRKYTILRKGLLANNKCINTK